MSCGIFSLATDANADVQSLRLKEAGETISTLTVTRHFIHDLVSPSPPSSSSPSSSLLSPSVYKAAGLGAYDLYDEVDYDTWYSSQLLNELRIQDPRSEWWLLPPPPLGIKGKTLDNETRSACTLVTLYRYKIVRHRVVWLLGNWVGVKMSSSLRPSLYSVLTQVLQPSEDIVVSIALV